MSHTGLLRELRSIELEIKTLATKKKKVQEEQNMLKGTLAILRNTTKSHPEVESEWLILVSEEYS